MNSVRETIVAGLVLVLIFGVMAHCMGCSSPHAEPAVIEKRAQHLIEQEQYGRALAACRAKGKDAGSYDVYEACAREADAKAGVK